MEMGEFSLFYLSLYPFIYIIHTDLEQNSHTLEMSESW